VLAVTALGVVVLLGATAPPAGAHSLTGTQASNYETTITGLAPTVPGLTIRVIDLGARLELHNASDHVVEVLGYDDEPYLRVGRTTVERNARSPATFLNRTQLLPGPVPPSYDAAAAPVWQRIGSAGVVRWHDHRAHWMATSEPPVVSRDPGRRHVLIPHWTVPLVVDGRPVILSGQVVWVPGPSPVPWVAAAIALGAILLVAASTRAAVRLTVVALGAAALVELVLATAAWRWSTASVGGRLGAVAYELGAALLAIGALVQLARRRSLYAAGPLLLLAGLAVAISGGLANVTQLFRSQLPTVLAPTVARVLVAAALGLGVALAAIGARNLARREARPVPRIARPTTQGAM